MSNNDNNNSFSLSALVAMFFSLFTFLNALFDTKFLFIFAILSNHLPQSPSILIELTIIFHLFSISVRFHSFLLPIFLSYQLLFPPLPIRNSNFSDINTDFP